MGDLTTLCHLQEWSRYWLDRGSRASGVSPELTAGRGPSSPTSATCSSRAGSRRPRAGSGYPFRAARSLDDLRAALAGRPASSCSTSPPPASTWTPPSGDRGRRAAGARARLDDARSLEDDQAAPRAVRPGGHPRDAHRGAARAAAGVRGGRGAHRAAGRELVDGRGGHGRGSLRPGSGCAEPGAAAAARARVDAEARGRGRPHRGEPAQGRAEERDRGDRERGALAGDDGRDRRQARAGAPGRGRGQALPADRRPARGARLRRPGVRPARQGLRPAVPVPRRAPDHGGAGRRRPVHPRGDRGREEPAVHRVLRGGGRRGDGAALPRRHRARRAPPPRAGPAPPAALRDDAGDAGGGAPRRDADARAGRGAAGRGAPDRGHPPRPRLLTDAERGQRGRCEG